MSSESTSARVLLLGFGEFERHALSSYLRLSSSGKPTYEQVQSVPDADFIIADADHPGVIDIVLADDRAPDTVFIGSLAPEGALGWAMRPIDPMQVFREIDAAVALRRQGRDGPPITTSPGTLDAPSRRAGDVAAAPAALLVDDSEIALRYLQRQLESLGLRCEMAVDSTRAVQLLSQRHFDIVFLDLDLGPDSETDGLTLCQRLKRAHRPPGSGLPPKVIIVSAHDSATDRVRGTFAGCDAYLGKPIDDAALQSHLRRLGLLAEPPPKRRSKRRREGAPTSGPTPLV